MTNCPQVGVVIFENFTPPEISLERLKLEITGAPNAGMVD